MNEQHAIMERTLAWDLETWVCIIALSLLFVQHWKYRLMFS